ncbi:hypothetical protein G3918_09865, partial [Neisseria meningitidis]|nr:hypothetical protein [Neisseria meningitidis]
RYLAENPSDFDPRKYLSKTIEAMKQICLDRYLDFTFWIPTFVGMTGFWFPCGWIRHSRAGGNPELSVQKLIG